MSVQILSAKEAMNMFISDNKHKVLMDELTIYQKVVKYNPQMFYKITTASFVCGSDIDPESCSPITEEIKNSIIRYVFSKILDGMKINGEFENWSCGFLGSRWFDIDASKFGISYIRVAFYSKKYNPQSVIGDKPFFITITAEKSRN